MMKMNKLQSIVLKNIQLQIFLSICIVFHYFQALGLAKPKIKYLPMFPCLSITLVPWFLFPSHCYHYFIWIEIYKYILDKYKYLPIVIIILFGFNLWKSWFSIRTVLHCCLQVFISYQRKPTSISLVFRNCIYISLEIYPGIYVFSSRLGTLY